MQTASQDNREVDKMSSRAFMGSVAFLLAFSWIVAEFTGTTTELLNPITLAVSGGLLAVVIGASATPIAKGAALLLLFIDITIHLVYSSVNPLLLGLIVAPIILTLGMSMAQIGQT